MTTHKLAITDVVLRDAHQSLFATRMRLDDMLPIAEKIRLADKVVWNNGTQEALRRQTERFLSSLTR